MNKVLQSNEAKNHARLTANDIMDDYLRRPFYTASKNADKSNVNLPKYQQLFKIVSAPQETVHIKGNRFL